MATASTNRTIWTLSIIGILGFLAWKLWPTIRKQLNMSGGGGVGTAGGASQQYPYQQGQGQGQGSGFGSIGAGGGGGSIGRNDSGSLTSWINGILNQGYSNAQNIPDTEDTYLGEVDAQGIPLENDQQTLQNLPSYTYNDPNAPWNSGSSISEYGGGWGSTDVLDPASFGSDSGGDSSGGLGDILPVNSGGEDY